MPSCRPSSAEPQPPMTTTTAPPSPSPNAPSPSPPPAASPSSSRRLPRGPLSATSPPTAPSSRPSTASLLSTSSTSATPSAPSGPRSLEALASRAGADAPRVRLTVVSSTAAGVVAEIGGRIEKFARLMGVPLEFRAIAAPALPRLIDALRPKKLELREGEVVAVNCVGALQRAGCEDSRDSFLRAAAVLRPRVLTVVEDEADFGAASEFMESFEECLWFYGSYFEMLEKASRRCATSGLLWRGSASGASSDCWRARAAQTQ
ncbi:hypothetical protein ZIOFF_022647 [Zingiber officinale]|uniref:Uncharacterized protein n=2 Tax=Zingiber officinale TaxID=94328 RepID=A0A8J5H5H9_ZINOF|nr:hypothetical protein ZIOFF_022647 [Zingiber officinale]